MQGKESKHSAIKQEIKNGPNRYNSDKEVASTHAIRKFYIPYHFTVSENYHLQHYESHIQKSDPDKRYCTCLRILD